MQSGQRDRRLLKQPLQLRHRRTVLTFVNEARRCLANPSIRAFESRYALTHRGLAPPPRSRSSKTLRNHPPNAATVITAVEIQVLLNGLRDRPRVLDHLPVHVHDVQTTLRTVLEMHRPEPRVSRSQKLNTLLVGRTTRHPAHPVGLQHLPVDQVAPSIADENVVDEVRAIGITAVHRRPSGPREITRDPPTALDHAWDYPTNSPPRPNNPPRLVGTNPEHLSRGSVGSDAHPRRRQSDPGIARSMRPVQGHPLEMIAVAAHESISHRIERESVLTAARLRTERFGQRIEAEIQTPQIETGSLRTRPDHTISPIGTGGPVKAVIQPPIE